MDLQEGVAETGVLINHSNVQCFLHMEKVIKRIILETSAVNLLNKTNSVTLLPKPPKVKK